MESGLQTCEMTSLKEISEFKRQTVMMWNDSQCNLETTRGRYYKSNLKGTKTNNDDEIKTNAVKQNRTKLNQMDKRTKILTHTGWKHTRAGKDEVRAVTLHFCSSHY